MIWLIVTTSFVAYLAEAGSPLAGGMSSGHGGGSLKSAERALAEVKSHFTFQAFIEHWMKAARLAAPASGRSPQPGEIREGALSEIALDKDVLQAVRNEAALALMRRPLSSRAHQLMGEANHLAGDHAKAVLFVERAAELSRHETAALFLTLHHKLARNDLVRSVHDIDAIMRTKPELATLVAVPLARVAETPEGAIVVKERILPNPPWLGTFLDSTLNAVTNPRAPLDLFLYLKANGIKFASRTMNDYLNLLISHGLAELANHAWMLMLTEERLAAVRLVYNGEFDFPSSGSPFDWLLRPGAGSSIEIAYPSDDPKNAALKIEASPGRVQFGDVTQRLMIPPGSYTLSGRVRGELKGRRGLRWQISCADGKNMRLLTESPALLGSPRRWESFRAPLQIPNQGCSSQLLRLIHEARHASEQFITGTLWLDSISIVADVDRGTIGAQVDKN